MLYLLLLYHVLLLGLIKWTMDFHNLGSIFYAHKFVHKKNIEYVTKNVNENN